MIKKIVLLLIIATIALSRRSFLGFPWKQNVASTPQADNPYQVLYYTQKVSHFNFKMTGKTWKQKYLINITNWSKS